MQQYKNAQVIMLPTDKIVETRKGYYTNGLSLNNSKYDKSLVLFTSVDHLEIPNPQHLYIISDDEIKEGDWIYNELSGIGKYVKNEEFNDGIVVIYNNQGFEVAEDIKNVKKIIATTDISLRIPYLNNLKIQREVGDVLQNKSLPQPSQQFIEKYIESYNKGVILSDVSVEYENIKIKVGQYAYLDDVRLKINPDNTINIKQQKNSWNRDEVVELLKLFENNIEELMDSDDDDNMFTNINLDKWIEQNL